MTGQVTAVTVQTNERRLNGMAQSNDGPVDSTPVLDAKDVAAFLKVSVRTVWRLARNPEFPQPIALGRRVARWRAGELISYLDRLQPAG